ncbi:MAG: class I SAM-dependent methyltransferase [Candidatus Heimdallarchaeaceae archaeon]
MKTKELLRISFEKKMNREQLQHLPSGYSIIGDIAIFHNINEVLEEYKKDIGNIIINSDPRVRVVVEQNNTVGEYRKPIIKHLAGEKRTLTIHKEYNTIFHVDVSKITFSPGNKGERGHLIKLVRNQEIICDMFACVGNLSIPIAVNNPNIMIYAIEINKDAYTLLKRNIIENNIQGRYFAVLGDNRKKTPDNFADRVLMGYFESDELQLIRGVKAIKTKGWLHFHFKSEREDYRVQQSMIETIIANLSHSFKLYAARRIKKLSPKFYHMCFDIYIEK